ncbi:hypothetical protein Chor_013716 [Crotalus horridus]
MNWRLQAEEAPRGSSGDVLGTLFVYSLFVMEPFQGIPWEKMEEILYSVHALSWTLEFLVALCVVVYGIWGSIAGEWTWLGASVILVHGYFNVWLRAQSSWISKRSFCPETPKFCSHAVTSERNVLSKCAKN